MFKLDKTLYVILISIIYFLFSYLITDEKNAITITLLLLLIVFNIVDISNNSINIGVNPKENKYLKFGTYTIVLYIILKGLLSYMLTINNIEATTGSLIFITFSILFGIGFSLISQTLIAYLLNIIFSLEKNISFFYKKIAVGHIVPVIATTLVIIINWFYFKGNIIDDKNATLMYINRLIFGYADLFMILFLFNLYELSNINTKKSINLAIVPYLLLGLPQLIKKLLE